MWEGWIEMNCSLSLALKFKGQGSLNEGSLKTKKKKKKEGGSSYNRQQTWNSRKSRQGKMRNAWKRNRLRAIK